MRLRASEGRTFSGIGVCVTYSPRLFRFPAALVGAPGPLVNSPVPHVGSRIRKFWNRIALVDASGALFGTRDLLFRTPRRHFGSRIWNIWSRNPLLGARSARFGTPGAFFDARKAFIDSRGPLFRTRGPCDVRGRSNFRTARRHADGPAPSCTASSPSKQALPHLRIHGAFRSASLPAGERPKFFFHEIAVIPVLARSDSTARGMASKRPVKWQVKWRKRDPWHGTGHSSALGVRTSCFPTNTAAPTPARLLSQDAGSAEQRSRLRQGWGFEKAGNSGRSSLARGLLNPEAAGRQAGVDLLRLRGRRDEVSEDQSG